MGSSWIKDKVVSAVEADVKENGGDANEVIWQLSKELKKMVRVNGAGVREIQKIGHLDPEVFASIDADCIGDATIKGRIGTGVVTLPPVPEEFHPEALQALSDYELAELGVNLRVERQRRIDVRHESAES